MDMSIYAPEISSANGKARGLPKKPRNYILIFIFIGMCLFSAIALI
jgi:hypothetical protein